MRKCTPSPRSRIRQRCSGKYELSHSSINLVCRVPAHQPVFKPVNISVGGVALQFKVKRTTFPGAPLPCGVVARVEIEPLMDRVVLPCFRDPEYVPESLYV
jgi:hypothetical protein